MSEENNRKLLLLQTRSGDYEGLYVGKSLIEQGDKLGEGNWRQFWLGIGKAYQIGPDDLIIKELSEVDNDFVEDVGEMPDDLTAFYMTYGTDRA